MAILKPSQLGSIVAVSCLIGSSFMLTESPAHAQAGPDPNAMIGGIFGLMNQMARQAQQQQLQQQEQQRQQQQRLLYQQQLQAQQLQQQRAEADRQKAASEAQERQAERQQAEARAAAAVKARAEAHERQIREAANRLRADPALSLVLGSDGRDITALVVGHDTPNVVRNLKGDPEFQKGASACLPFGGVGGDPDTLDPQFLRHVQEKIEQKGGLAESSLLLTTCDPADLGNYDLVIFSRAQVSAATVEALSPLVEMIRKRRWVPFATYTVAEFRAEEAAKRAAAHLEEARKAAERQAALTSFEARDASIISAIHVVSPAPVACLLSSPDVEGLHYLLKRKDSPFATVITSDSVIRDLPSADALFIGLKRQDCAAAVAPAGALKEVMAGLVRDGTAMEVDAGEIGADRLAGWKVLLAQDLAAAQEQQAKDLAERRRKDAEQTAEADNKRILEEQRRANDEAARQGELDRMRKLVASKANAVLGGFDRVLRKHMQSVEAELEETKQRAKAGTVLTDAQYAALRAKYDKDRIEFEPWAQQFEILVKQGWEFGDEQATLEDYGRAQWRSRTLESVAIRVEFPMINREIGEKRVDCYDFFWINDEEFQFMRQIGSVRCDEYDARFAEWSQANGFISQWKLLATQ